MMTPKGTDDKRLGKEAFHRWRFVVLAVISVLAISLQFIFEHSEAVIQNVRMPHWMQHRVQQAGSLFDPPFAYIPRPHEAHYVGLVSISEDSEGALQGPCAVRSFLTKLLPALVAARPTMIVSDIALAGDNASDACQGAAPETQNLVTTINVAAKSTPLVIGQASWRLDDVPTARAQRLRDQGFGENDLLLRKMIDLDGKSENVSFGLIRLNQQIERVPVVWFSHESETSGAQPVPSLGLAAAEMYRATFPNGNARLESLETAGYHPVTDLLPESAFAVVPAISVMCSEQGPNRNWQNCSDPLEGNRDLRANLRGRVVVVGFSDHADDLWKTSVGQMAGYVLQANYIEALLDARVYRPVGFWMTCLLSVLWLFVVELPFWVLNLPIRKGLIFSAGSSMIILVLAKYVALVNFGLYISLFAPSVLLIAVSVLHLLARRFEE
jgi:hypothetical protein